MVRAKNYETVSTFVEVMQKKLWPLFFPDTVYISILSPLANFLVCMFQKLWNLVGV